MFWKTLAKWLPLLFIGIILILVYFGASFVLALAASRSGGVPLPATELKDKIDEIKWTLGLIVTAAGLFTLAQGIAAGFSAQSFVKQSEDAFKKLEKQSDEALMALDLQSANALAKQQVKADESLAKLELLEAQVRTHYPLFDRQRAQAFSSLRELVSKHSLVKNTEDGFDQRRRFYERIDVENRQRILAVDRAIAYEIAGQSDPPEVFAKQSRQLAQFYWSKFIYERGLGYGSLSDLERAEHLLMLGKEELPEAEQFAFYNDVGNVRLELYKATKSSRKVAEFAATPKQEDPSLASAREAFRKSRQLHPAQTRASHNLAIIFTYHVHAAAKDDRIANLRNAVQLLEDGLRYPNWEVQPVAEFRCGSLYNLACVHALLAILLPSERAHEVEEVIRLLKEAGLLGFVPQEDVENDYQNEGGDIKPLLSEGKILVDGQEVGTEEVCTEPIREALVGLKTDLYRNSPKS